MRKAVILTVAGIALLLWALIFQYSIRIPQQASIGCGGPVTLLHEQYGWPVPYFFQNDTADMVSGFPAKRTQIEFSIGRLLLGLALWAVLFAAILIGTALALKWRPGLLRHFHLTTGILVVLGAGLLLGLQIESDVDIRFRYLHNSEALGWPVPTRASQRGLTNAQTPAGRAAEAVVVDAIFSFALLLCLAAASEWMLRRRSEAVRSDGSPSTP